MIVIGINETKKTFKTITKLWEKRIYIAKSSIKYKNINWTLHLIEKIKILLGSISSFLILNCGKDCKGWRSQFRSVAKEWSDSVTLKSLFFAKQKATRNIKNQNPTSNLSIILIRFPWNIFLHQDGMELKHPLLQPLQILLFLLRGL